MGEENGVLPIRFQFGDFTSRLQGLTAYLDPGSGSLIVQILVAIIVGALATFRFWKARLLSLIGIRQDAENDNESDEYENSEVKQP